MSTPREIIADRKGDWIQTYSGRQFWPMDPRPEDIDIVDIAHALSMLCRFGGHCKRFYSVAEHCVLLSDVADDADALYALLHDASEAYLVDVPRPIKRMLPGYAEAEDVIMAAICDHYGLLRVMPPDVKRLDRAILMDERLQNMEHAPVRWTTDGKPIGVTLQFWSPDKAKAAFLEAFARLRRLPAPPAKHGD